MRLRRSSDFLIIARTNAARQPNGLDEALHRLAKGTTPQQIAEEVAADMHRKHK